MGFFLYLSMFVGIWVLIIAVRVGGQIRKLYRFHAEYAFVDGLSNATIEHRERAERITRELSSLGFEIDLTAHATGPVEGVWQGVLLSRNETSTSRAILQLLRRESLRLYVLTFHTEFADGSACITGTATSLQHLPADPRRRVMMCNWTRSPAALWEFHQRRLADLPADLAGTPTTALDARSFLQRVQSDEFASLQKFGYVKRHRQRPEWVITRKGTALMVARAIIALFRKPGTTAIARARREWDRLGMNEWHGDPSLPLATAVAAHSVTDTSALQYESPLVLWEVRVKRLGGQVVVEVGGPNRLQQAIRGWPYWLTPCFCFGMVALTVTSWAEHQSGPPPWQQGGLWAMTLIGLGFILWGIRHVLQARGTTRISANENGLAYANAPSKPPVATISRDEIISLAVDRDPTGTTSAALLLSLSDEHRLRLLARSNDRVVLESARKALAEAMRIVPTVSHAEPQSDRAVYGAADID